MAHAKLTSEAVRAAAKKLGRPVDDAQADLLVTYLEQLIKWNRKMNLVGKSDWETVFRTLIVDSLFLADFLNEQKVGGLCLDLGAGAGLPGIPLRSLWQEGEYWLVEVREKRVMFMRSVLGRMKLPGTDVFHGRAEDVLDHLGDGEDVVADTILSRAFMPWPKLLDFVHPMMRSGGTLVILSNDAPPKASELPEEWSLGDASAYPVAGGKRHFWALQRA